jgi:hypothetical protein
MPLPPYLAISVQCTRYRDPQDGLDSMCHLHIASYGQAALLNRSFPFPAVTSSRHHTYDSAFCTTTGRSSYDLALRISTMNAMWIITHTSNRPIHGPEHTRIYSSTFPGPSFHFWYRAYNLRLPTLWILEQRCKSFEQLCHDYLTGPTNEEHRLQSCVRVRWQYKCFQSPVLYICRYYTLLVNCMRSW